MDTPLSLKPGLGIVTRLRGRNRRIGFVAVPRRLVRRRVRFSVLGPMSIGAALMYFLDPQRGAFRRARARDKLAHFARTERQLLGKGMRDAKNRGRGLIARMHIVRSEEVDDDVLLARVRSALGRHVSHPRAIEVEAHGGAVTLRGPILEDELERLVRATRRIRGVASVNSELEPHHEAGHNPNLQGEGHIPRPMLRREHWTPALRIATGGAGLAVGSLGLLRQGTLGKAMAAVGGALLARALTDMPLRKLIGLKAGAEVVTVQKTITVDAPVDDVYELWSRFENLASFMENIEEVTTQADRRLSHWRLRGPAGIPFEWEAELVEDEPCERVAWRTISGSIEHQGVVRFEPRGASSTRVHVRMSYNPPAGAIGHAVATLLGRNPKAVLARDLARMKSLLEQGRTTVRGESVRLSQLH